MRKLLLAGLALSAAFIALPRPAAAEDFARPWCGVENGRSRACDYYTREQCAASRERLGGGDCFENPDYHGTAAPGERVKTHHYRVAHLKTHHVPAEH